MDIRDGSARRPTRLASWALHRGVRPVIILCSLAVILALIAVSPLSLKLIAIKRGINWAQLSNIGQAYGAISAVLSGLALVAVSVSIRLQSKESLANRRQVHRDMHMRLTEMAMADPDIMQCWSPTVGNIPYEKNRQLQYINLMISFWYTQWELKDLTDDALRAIARAQLFQSEVGRKYWRMYRSRWESESLGSRLNRFCGILDDALRYALESRSTTDPVGKVSSPPWNRSIANMATVASAIFVGGVVMRGVLRRHGRSASR
jgi:hypothetical protein